MEGKTPKMRWIGLGTVGALAVAATVVTLSVTGGPHDGSVNLEAGKATNGPAPNTANSTQSTTAQHHAAEAKPTARSKAISPQAATKRVLYTGLWAPGSGEQHWRTNMSATSFNKWRATYPKLRIQDLRISADGIYTAVLRPGTGAEKWRTGMTPKQFDDARKLYAKQGLGVTSLDTGHGITAVWRPTPTQRIAIGLTQTAFSQRLTAEAHDEKQPMRPVLADTYAVTGGTHWIGVFQSGPASYQVRTTPSRDDFYAYVAKYAQPKYGLRLVSLGTKPYTGVWRPGSGDTDFWTGTISDFQDDNTKFYKRGLRLVRVGRWTS